MRIQLSRAFSIGLVLVLASAFAAGCSWMGRTAGRAQAKVENNMESMEKGYHKGYETERAKSQQPQQPQ